MGAFVPMPETAVAPLAAMMTGGAEGAREAYARAQQTGEALRDAVADSASAATRGLVELNGKMLDLVRAQSDAAFALWRSTLTAGSLSEAIKAQTSGLRQAYEVTSTQWKDIAETTGRVMGETARPIQNALTGPRR